MEKTGPRVPIDAVTASAYTIPTDKPEADGTIHWESTTLVLAEVEGGGRRGIGYTYSHRSIADLVAGKLAETVSKLDAMDPPAAWRAMQREVRDMAERDSRRLRSRQWMWRYGI